MSHYRRLHVPGGTWFFTVNLARRGATTLTDHIEILRAAYRATALEHPIRPRAMVVMPDHIHAVWTLPEGDGDFSVRWRKIKGRFTHTVGRAAERSPSKVYKRDGGIWQRRFWEHRIRDDDELRRAVAYVWENPVRHGFVEKPEDWPYSSVR
jgi:putative transposase